MLRGGVVGDEEAENSLRRELAFTYQGSSVVNKIACIFLFALEEKQFIVFIHSHEVLPGPAIEVYTYSWKVRRQNARLFNPLRGGDV